MIIMYKEQPDYLNVKDIHRMVKTLYITCYDDYGITHTGNGGDIQCGG